MPVFLKFEISQVAEKDLFALRLSFLRTPDRVRGRRRNPVFSRLSGLPLPAFAGTSFARVMVVWSFSASC